MIIVSNTSPISNLAKVGQLSLMQQLYGEIVIPNTVYEELLDIRAGDIVITAVQPSKLPNKQPTVCGRFGYSK